MLRSSVWDLIEHTLLACVRSKVHKIRGSLQAVCYNSHSRCLLFASDQISFLNLKLRPYLHADVVVSHYESVLGLLFIKEFKQVISCTESGIVRLWDFLTGRQVHEFRAHNGQAVTSMTLDTTERRLITGSRDGTCCIWNVHNGQLLRILKSHDSLEITDVIFVVINNNCSILSVGWDRRVNVFKDEREYIKHICFPQDQFIDDDQNESHKEDILCIDKSLGDLIATGDYGGTTIVWNMSSKKIFATLKNMNDDNQLSEENPNVRIINRVKFIDTRYGQHDVANLISSGPYGYIHFWNIYKNGILMAKFRPNKERITIVTQIKLNSTCNLLFVADSLGFIFIYEVEKYALEHESKSPSCIRTWRAHIDSVTGLDYIEPTQILISCALDWTIRLWNLHGNFIGTFGQTIPWNLYDPATYQHPSVPLDVLTDPKSLPQKQQTTEEERSTTTAAAATVPTPAVFVNKQTIIDDETIDNNVRNTISKLQDSQSTEVLGKRLRYLRAESVVSMHRDSSNHYQYLRFYPVDDNPPTTTTTTANTNVHFPDLIKL